MNTTSISANNGFLMSVGLITGGKSKAVTTVGKQLGDALTHGIEDEIRRLWRTCVEDSEFLKNVVSAIRIRRGMEEGALRSHIAYSAGAVERRPSIQGLARSSKSCVRQEQLSKKMESS